MNTIHSNINNYYTKKISQYGATPKGADWNGEESQFIRFEQLSKIINKEKFSINDIGCGYGKYHLLNPVIALTIVDFNTRVPKRLGINLAR